MGGFGRKFNKIIDDTLKSPEGKWSRKSLTMFTSFIVSVIMGFYIVISHYFTVNPISNYSFDVFIAFLASSLGMSAMTLLDKFNVRKNNDSSSSIEEDPPN